MLALFVQNVNAQTIELTASYNTIGVKVINIGNADSCRVEYKVASQTNWLLAYPQRLSRQALHFHQIKNVCRPMEQETILKLIPVI